jgi:hypothetical protein
MNPIIGSTYPRQAAEAVKVLNNSELGSGFSYAMGQASAGGDVLTPTLAENLMHRSMTTGVPTAELEQYGGYSAVKAMFDANGGKYSLNSIPTQQRQQLAQELANTGVGNIELLVSIAGKETNEVVDSSQTDSQVQDLMHRSMTTGVQTSEMEKYGGYSAIKTMYEAGGGSYSLAAMAATQRKELATQVANTGVGNMSVLLTEKIGVSEAVLQAMASNGIDKAAIDELSLMTKKFNPPIFIDSNSYINTLMKELDSK